MGKIVALCIGLWTVSAQAYDFHEIQYNQVTKDLSVTLVFEGGNKLHTFEWIVDPCETNETPNGIHMLIEDVTGYDDTGTDLMFANTTVNLRDQLAACRTNEVLLSIRLRADKVRSFVVPK